MTAIFAGEGERVSAVRNLRIEGPAGELPIRVYQPAGSGLHPILIYFHGGGWVLGDLDGVDPICRILTNRLDSVVVSVEYRLAPEHTFPAAPEDCYQATRWVARNAKKVRGDARKLAVCGDSAGGNLAAVVSLMARDRGGPKLGLQVLVYPVTDVTPSAHGSRQESPGLTPEDMKWFIRKYLVKPSDAKNQYVSPMRAENLGNLPPARIVTAEYDVLTRQCEDYAVRLIESKNAAKIHRFNGQLHGFFTLPGSFEAARVAVDVISKEFRSVLG